MSFLFGGSKPPPTPKVPPPPAIPTIDSNVQDYASKMAKQRSGMAKTVVTGNLTPISTGKKTLLGG